MSVEKHLEEYLRHHKDSWHPSGTLQRIEWRNNDSTLAVPRSIVRRLQEMQNEHVIAVRFTGRKRTPEYRWIPFEWRGRYIPSHSQGLDGAWKQVAAQQLALA